MLGSNTPRLMEFACTCIKDRESPKNQLLQNRVDSDMYGTSLKKCINSRNMPQGKLIHTHIIKGPFMENKFLSNVIIQMYAKCGAVEEAKAVFETMYKRNVFTWTAMLGVFSESGNVENARRVFDGMPYRDVASWNAMIGIYVHKGFAKEAFELFQQMQIEGVMPDKVTFITILVVCPDPNTLDEGRQLHPCIENKGLNLGVAAGTDMYTKCESVDDTFQDLPTRDVFYWNYVIAAYTQSKGVEDARKMFDEMPERNVVSWNTMIAAYVQHGRNKEALRLFQQMHIEGAKPDRVTFLSILDACVGLRDLNQGRHFHKLIMQRGFESNVIVQISLINMYGKCGSVKKAREVFDSMASRTVVTWNAMIAAYIQCGSLYDAQGMFDEMPERSLVSWNSMIAAYAQQGQIEKSHQLFERMQRDCMRPNKITVLTLLDACAKQCNLQKGKQVHRFVMNQGMESDVVIGGAVVNMYGKCGCLEDAKWLFIKMPVRNLISWNIMIAVCAQCGKLKDARTVFDEMPVRDVVSWNAIIAACAQHGQSKEALELFQHMQDEGILPDKVTFVSIIDACTIEVAEEQGKQIHTWIKSMELDSDLVVGNALITMYGKCGKLGEAQGVFDKMTERNVITWTAMIAAYSQQGQGKVALKLFQEMKAERIVPNAVTFVSILCACSHTGLTDIGCYFFISLYHDYGITAILENFTCMVDILGRAGWLDESEDLVNNMMHCPTLASWKTLLGVCKTYNDTNRTSTKENITKLL